MKLRKPKRSDLILLVIIAVLIIPQTRKPIQVILHKGLALFGPSIENESNRTVVSFQDWLLEDLQGNLISFSELKNKVVFLNFWATWCPPCIAEMQSIQDLHDSYKDNVVFLLISNENPEVVRAFKNKKGYTLNSFKPLTENPESFNIRSIPRTFLINKKGEIVIDKGGAANWNSDKVRNQLDELLKGS